MKNSSWWPFRRSPETEASQQFWVTNRLAYRCFDCRRAFTSLRRRHHCRRCGGVFCSVCLQLTSSGVKQCVACVASEDRARKKEQDVTVPQLATPGTGFPPASDASPAREAPQAPVNASHIDFSPSPQVEQCFADGVEPATSSIAASVLCPNSVIIRSRASSQSLTGAMSGPCDNESVGGASSRDLELTSHRHAFSARNLKELITAAQTQELNCLPMHVEFPGEEEVEYGLFSAAVPSLVNPYTVHLDKLLHEAEEAILRRERCLNSPVERKSLSLRPGVVFRTKNASVSSVFPTTVSRQRLLLSAACLGMLAKGAARRTRPSPDGHDASPRTISSSPSQSEPSQASHSSWPLPCLCDPKERLSIVLGALEERVSLHLQLRMRVLMLELVASPSNPFPSEEGHDTLGERCAWEAALCGLAWQLVSQTQILPLELRPRRSSDCPRLGDIGSGQGVHSHRSILYHTRLICLSGGALMDSQIVSGIAFVGVIASQTLRKPQSRPRVLLLGGEWGGQDACSRIGIQEYLQTFAGWLENASSRFLSWNPTIVVVEKSLHYRVQQKLKARHIAVITCAMREVLEQLEEALEATIVDDLRSIPIGDAANPSPNPCGTCSNFFINTLSNLPILTFSGFKHRAFTTLLLRGGSRRFLDAMRQLMRQGLVVAYHLALQAHLCLDFCGLVGTEGGVEALTGHAVCSAGYFGPRSEPPREAGEYTQHAKSAAESVRNALNCDLRVIERDAAGKLPGSLAGPAAQTSKMAGLSPSIGITFPRAAMEVAHHIGASDQHLVRDQVIFTWITLEKTSTSNTASKEAGGEKSAATEYAALPTKGAGARQAAWDTTSLDCVNSDVYGDPVVTRCVLPFYRPHEGDEALGRFLQERADSPHRRLELLVLERRRVVIRTTREAAVHAKNVQPMCFLECWACAQQLAKVAEDVAKLHAPRPVSSHTLHMSLGAFVEMLLYANEPDDDQTATAHAAVSDDCNTTSPRVGFFSALCGHPLFVCASLCFTVWSSDLQYRCKVTISVEPLELSSVSRPSLTSAPVQPSTSEPAVQAAVTGDDESLSPGKASTTTQSRADADGELGDATAEAKRWKKQHAELIDFVELVTSALSRLKRTDFALLCIVLPSTPTSPLGVAGANKVIPLLSHQFFVIPLLHQQELMARATKALAGPIEGDASPGPYLAAVHISIPILQRMVQKVASSTEGKRFRQQVLEPVVRELYHFAMRAAQWRSGRPETISVSPCVLKNADDKATTEPRITVGGAAVPDAHIVDHIKDVFPALLSSPYAYSRTYDSYVKLHALETLVSFIIRVADAQLLPVQSLARPATMPAGAPKQPAAAATTEIRALCLSSLPKVITVSEPSTLPSAPKAAPSGLLHKGAQVHTPPARAPLATDNTPSSDAYSSSPWSSSDVSDGDDERSEDVETGTMGLPSTGVSSSRTTLPASEPISIPESALYDTALIDSAWNVEAAHFPAASKSETMTEDAALHLLGSCVRESACASHTYRFTDVVNFCDAQTVENSLIPMLAGASDVTAQASRSTVDVMPLVKAGIQLPALQWASPGWAIALPVDLTEASRPAAKSSVDDGSAAKNRPVKRTGAENSTGAVMLQMQNWSILTFEVLFPMQFEALRFLWSNGKPSDILTSLQHGDFMYPKSGKTHRTMTFRKTADNRFIVKQIKAAEWSHFVEIGPLYFARFAGAYERRQESNSLLVVVLGAFAVSKRSPSSRHATTQHYILMENTITRLAPQRLLDLKGSLRNRLCEWGREQVYLDENLLRRQRAGSFFFVSEEDKNWIKSVVVRDTELLAASRTMDYSLLVWVENSANEIIQSHAEDRPGACGWCFHRALVGDCWQALDTAERALLVRQVRQYRLHDLLGIEGCADACRECEPMAAACARLHLPGSEARVSMRIIDYLHPYTFHKLVERQLKTLATRFEAGEAREPTVIEPLEYKQRFDKFMNRCFVGVSCKALQFHRVKRMTFANQMRPAGASQQASTTQWPRHPCPGRPNAL